MGPMAQTEEYHCDRCDATIIADRFQEPKQRQIAVEQRASPGSYEFHERVLCRACETEFLEWIDDGVVDRSEQVDMAHGVEVAQDLERVGNNLREISELLVAHNSLNGDRRE